MTMTAATPAPGFEIEATAIGPQTLVPGVVPITQLDRLTARAAAPLEPKKPQHPCDLGLFDINARNQLDLFQPKDL
ncbi:hypothetical protein ACVWZA_004025 [Sphingomonas sp. UYAg733]